MRSLIFICLIALTVACFGPVLLDDRQFAMTDAATFYFPLYQRVQQEWSAGRLPLWMPEANGGEPLLANPTAAVLYPGKLIYAALPYAWAARIYVIAHVLLACATMIVLLRHWEVAWCGAALGAISYAFGGPVLYQYSNVVFLVGAAWTPLGFRAADRWVRLGRRAAIAELAVILALLVLGGNPEAAYVVMICAGAYAVGLATARSSIAKLRPLLVGLPILYVVQLAVESRIAVGKAAAFHPNGEVPWLPSTRSVAIVFWSVMLYVVWRDWRDGTGPWRKLFGLAAAGALAAMLVGAQVVPTLELFAVSGRDAALGPHDIYPYSLNPYRLVEWIWPNFSGTWDRGHRWWIDVIPPFPVLAIWFRSLYGGVLPLVLALSALAVRRGPPWRVWLTIVALVGLVGSFGEFAGPIFWLRQLGFSTNAVGALDGPGTAGMRIDGYLRDGDGGFYWFLGALLPGFSAFRFPCKLIAFTVLSLAALAGAGWDQLVRGSSRSARRWAVALLALTLVTLAAVAVAHDPIARKLTALSGTPESPSTLEVPASLAEARASLVQSAVMLALALALARLAPRRPALAGALALACLTIDLAIASPRFIYTAPQAFFDETPRMARLIEAAEKANPADGPFRIHRMSHWIPNAQANAPTPLNEGEFLRWSRGTLVPDVAIPMGYSYVYRRGTFELFDLQLFFTPYSFDADEETASRMGLKRDQPYIYFPRRAYDLCGARYFILPARLRVDHRVRGFLAFLPRTEMLDPDPRVQAQPESEAWKKWADVDDVRLLRNLDVYPRSWVVHRARLSKPIRGKNPAEQKVWLDQIFFPNDALWHSPDRRVNDPRQMAWVETDDFRAVSGFLSQAASDASERVTVVPGADPRRVELSAVLKSPGIVVLADTYFPGWTLTIDGRPAEILQVNRIMRGAAVPAGTHRLVFRYVPRSFEWGLGASLAGLLLVAVVSWRFRGRLSPANRL